jgi:predicted nucleic acid-binding protein
MNLSKAFIDTNVLLYALEMHPVYGGKAVRVLEMVDKGELGGVVSVLVQLEVCWFLESRKRLDEIGLVLDVLQKSRLDTVPVTGEDVAKAGELKQQYPMVEMNDLVNLCVMRRLGLSTIYTNDKHFNRFSDINPVF